MIKPVATYHLHITGLVQGVGFRPHVYQLAIQHQISGWVNNSNSGVHIELNATEEKAAQFYEEVIAKAPHLSNITHHTITKTDNKYYTGFEIQQSDEGSVENLMLTPDYAMCGECSAEMNDSSNRRYQYPFITCTNCGPRYSILHQLPYDRVNTSMAAFEQCAICAAEYNDPTNRRHYSQTNSCAVCGMRLAAFSATGDALPGERHQLIDTAIEALRQQQVIAVKGIGGFLLLCDATNAETVARLRARKHRPGKPFALMYPSIELVKNDFLLSIEAEAMLKSPAAPVVLLQKKSSQSVTLSSPSTSLATSQIAPGLSQLGVMLPYAPLLSLIAAAFNKPLIATSANVADSPIIYTNQDALQQLAGIADMIITHNREIATPEDDSVIRFADGCQQKIILRRSRGLAPSHFGYATPGNKTIVATGALMKSSFTFACSSNTFISQYLGNTDSFEAQESYKKTIQYFIGLFNQQPQVVIADKHPLYFTTQLAAEMSEQYQCTLVQVQHHKAHAAAVLAEHHLVHQANPVLCVVWDGTGLGDDHNSWGGEFFVYENNELHRRYHFDYFPVIQGDKMAREPRLSALAVCSEVWMAADILQSRFTATEWTFYQKILARNDLLQCCSVGRIFDAVAALLNICDKQSYEGEAALLLETLAQQYFSANGYAFAECYFMKGAHLHKIPTATLFAGIMADIQRKKPADFIAAKFHYSLAQLVLMVADNLGIKQIAFSGGVFQNAVLVSLLNVHAGQYRTLYFHEALSPNDENISFGQMVYYDCDIDGIQTTTASKKVDYTMNLA